ncbi:hypothetical protein DKX38_026955 [Salix brachista]|uniref:K+ potassium transporter integral membrane domain-containing protein n=1 Tax=Salix brachista TaxID=2182728 RepID=A0A5N5JMM3_9ROSI|nr:hypothetical protein DKX38_026955 [Salix brachista]
MAVCPKFSVSDSSWEIPVQEYGRALFESNNGSNNTTFPLLSLNAYQTIASTTVVFPCLLFAYSGQAAYLMKNTCHVVDAFYSSIPGYSSNVLGHTFIFLHRDCSRHSDAGDHIAYDFSHAITMALPLDSCPDIHGFITGLLNDVEIPERDLLLLLVLKESFSREDCCKGNFIGKKFIILLVKQWGLRPSLSARPYHVL